MLDALIKLAEKVAELAQYRESRNHARYETVIAPLFETARLVHADHVRMLQACLLRLENQEDLWRIAAQLQEERLAQAGVRHELVRDIAVLSDAIDDDKFVPFFGAARAYFVVDPLERAANLKEAAVAGGCAISTVRSIVARIREEAWSPHGPRERYLLNDLVQRYLQRFETKWLALSEAHARLVASRVRR